MSRRCGAAVAFALMALGCARVRADQVAAAAGCPAGVDFEADGYRIRNARVGHPFAFTRWLGALARDASQSAASSLAGQPFRYGEVRRVASEIEERQWNPAGAGMARVRVLASFTRVENCADQQLDVVYQLFSTDLSRSWTATIESRRRENDAPQSAAGMDAPKPPLFRLAPFARYNASEKLAAGGRLSLRIPAGANTALLAEGLGSARVRRVAASLRGSISRPGRIATADWAIDYLNRSDPVRAVARIRQARLMALASAETAPLGDAGAVLRFGGAIEGGALGAYGTSSGSRYGAVKLFAGMSLRGEHQVFSTSYGFEAASALLGRGIDWRKYISDTTHDFWWPVADHKPLEIESRLTTGIMQGAAASPEAARFFGGNQEHLFLPGEQWQIRANPVLRSVPANRLVRADGRPLSRFVAFNSTIAMAVWNRPLVPADITHDPEFETVLETGLGSAESALAAANMGKDPGMLAASARLDPLRAQLKSWRESLAAGTVAACVTAIQRAERRAKLASEKDPAERLGTLRALILPEPGAAGELDRAFAACGGVPAELAVTADKMKSAMKRVSTAAAEALAKKEMAPARRALRTILKEMNLFSISPVLVADAAYLPGAGIGNRYALGGGVRLSFVSHVLIDAGYARHLNRRPGDDPGALFFSLRLRELIQ